MSDAAYKIINGAKLTREEWQEAIDKEILKGGEHRTYEGFIATHYTDGKRQGYICTQHAFRKNGETGDGYTCGFGLHLEELDPNYITDINAMFIAYQFGRDKLKDLWARRKPKKKGVKP